MQNTLVDNIIELMGDDVVRCSLCNLLTPTQSIVTSALWVATRDDSLAICRFINAVLPAERVCYLCLEHKMCYQTWAIEYETFKKYNLTFSEWHNACRIDEEMDRLVEYRKSIYG